MSQPDASRSSEPAQASTVEQAKFESCGDCHTLTHCDYHGRCLAECQPSDLDSAEAAGVSVERAIQELLTDWRNTIARVRGDSSWPVIIDRADFNRLIAAVRSEGASQPAQAQTWQPIETAPKDGTVVLLWDGSHVGTGLWEWIDQRSSTGFWVCSAHGVSAEWSDLGVPPVIEPATHWMPLPARPKETP